MKNETKVGLLFVVTLGAIVAFSYYLGVINPFSSAKQIHIQYNFAGGIEVGSPVRVMGIKVGKVTDINFIPGSKDLKGEEVNLQLTISVSEKAWKTVKEDSRFFINLAGVIGERYVEIAPGSIDSKGVVAGGKYRGHDPPRVDQLISQSYSLAGKVLEVIENNEGDVVSIIKSVTTLTSNLNKTLAMLEKMSKGADFAKLLNNLETLTGDLAHVSGKLKGKDAEETYKLLHRLLWRLDDLDKEAIKKFFQDEGIKAKMF
ncbi:MAG: MlaD family protein [Bdellovibrionales bacterium]